MKLLNACLAAGSVLPAVIAAATSTSSGLVGKVETTQLPRVFSQCKDEGDFMLTFDDGPSKITASLLKKLKSEGVSATFFVNGKNGNRCIYDHASELQAAFKAGHTIGSHTWSHRYASSMTKKQFTGELKAVERAMINILGVKPKLYMPPYGEVNRSIPNIGTAMDILGRRGYSVVHWNVAANSGDDEGSAYALSKYKAFINSKPKPKSGISVSLDPSREVVDEVVSYAIGNLTEAGYKIVGAEKCLGVKLYDGYDPKAKLPKRNPKTWKCPKDKD